MCGMFMFLGWLDQINRTSAQNREKTPVTRPTKRLVPAASVQAMRWADPIAVICFHSESFVFLNGALVAIALSGVGEGFKVRTLCWFFV